MAIHVRGYKRSTNTVKRSLDYLLPSLSPGTLSFMPMRPESKLLGQALLDHHRARIKAAPPAPPGKRLMHARYTIPYSSLCAQAGRPDITRIVGGLLGEAAAWCAELGYPPLTLMAVNAESEPPGTGY